MDRHGADIRDLLEALDLRDVTLVSQSMGGNAVRALVDRSGTDRIRDIVIVGHAAAAAAPNPLADSIVIDRDGHAANIEQPAAFNRIPLGWLARRAAA